MSRFLVTGGAGFIGSHITQALLKNGHSTRVLDNFSSGKQENLGFIRQLKNPGAFELIKADIRDKEACQKACRGMDFVLHQAALRSVPKSLDNPAEYNQVNIQGTLNMLEAALRHKIKCFVFASSSSVYGERIRFPEREGDLAQPVSPYALTKLAGEYYCKIFTVNYGLNTVSLRYFNVFGPRQSLDDEYAVVVPKFISRMLGDERPPVHGTGRQSRDFTYVANVVEANLCAVKKNNLKGQVFNIAWGRDYSILELVAALNKIMDKQIKPVFEPKRKGDVFRTLADMTQAKKRLGFKPKIDFLKGLELAVEYFQRCRAK